MIQKFIKKSKESSRVKRAGATRVKAIKGDGLIFLIETESEKGEGSRKGRGVKA
jgi:hypothetical protein